MKKIKVIMALSLLTLLILMASVSVGSLAFAGQDVKFIWDPYTTDPIVGFKLYMASTPNVAVIPANLVATIPGQAVVTYTQANASVGLKYWVITAYTATQESDKSNEVSYTVKLKPPSGLSNTVVLTFTGHTTVIVANRK